jgi:hypothetical protein
MYGSKSYTHGEVPSLQEKSRAAPVTTVDGTVMARLHTDGADRRGSRMSGNIESSKQSVFAVRRKSDSSDFQEENTETNKSDSVELLHQQYTANRVLSELEPYRSTTKEADRS